MKSQTLKTILLVLILLSLIGGAIGIISLLSFRPASLNNLYPGAGDFVSSLVGPGVLVLILGVCFSVFFFYCLYRALARTDELEERLQEIERKTSQMQTSDLHSILDQLKNDPTISKGIFVPKGRKCMYCGKILSPDNTDIICDNCKRFLNQ